MSAYHLRTLGSLALHRDGPEGERLVGPSKALAVPAYLAGTPGHASKRQHVARLLWPRVETSQGRRSLRQALYYLAKNLEEDLVLSDRERIRLAPKVLSVDLWELEDALEEDDLERAVGLFGGDFLGGFAGSVGREFEGWADTHTRRIRSSIKAACYDLISRAIDAGDPGAAIGFAKECVGLDPLDGTAQRALIRSHLAAGDRAAAFRAYEGYRSLLESQFDDEPDADLREAVQEIREELFEEPISGSTLGSEVRRGAARSGASRAEAATDGPRPRESSSGRRQSGSNVRTSSDADDEGESSRVVAGLRARLPPGRIRAAAWVLVGAVGTLAAVAILAMFGGLPPQLVGGESAGWRAATGTIRAVTDTEEGPSTLRIEFQRGSPEVESVSTGNRALPSPEGRRLARIRREAGGVDIEIIDRGTGRTVTSLHEAADEVPLAWSPDGRQLLYSRSRRVADDEEYERRLYVVDLESGPSEGLPVPPLTPGSPNYSQVAWSPVGSHLAFRGVAEGRAAEPEVFVTEADGSAVTNISRHPAWDGDPSWSPDGRWIAFSSRRDGSADIFLSLPNGRGLRRLTFGPASERYPVWLGNRHIAFVSSEANPGSFQNGDIWLMNVHTRAARRLEADLRALRLQPGTKARGPRDRMITEVEITGVPGSLHPGQLFEPNLRAYDASGREIPAGRLPVRWNAEDTTVIRLDSDGAVAEVADTGRTRLVATAGGWRSDTLELASRHPAIRLPPVALAEDWPEGVLLERWAKVGTPKAYVKTTERPSWSTSGTPSSAEKPGLAMVNNGDANYSSGVLSREPVELGGPGFTLEFQARMPFTGRPYEMLSVQITGNAPIQDTDSWPRRSARGIGVIFNSPNGHPTVLTRTGRFPLESVGLQTPGSWHQYALQVAANGTVTYVVDGTVRWQSSRPLVDDVPASGRLYVGGASLHVDVEIGEVRVWRGERYGAAGPSGSTNAPTS